MKMLNILQKKVIHRIKESNEVLISDTTLRDGEQMPEVFFTPEQKVKIANYLADMGVYTIDAGFPVCSEGEKKCIKEVAENFRGISKGLIKPVITTLARAKKEDIDASYECLKRLRIKKGISIFLGSSPQHREKLRKTKEEILEMAKDSINYAKQYFNIISFSPEDASRTELDFLNKLYKEVINAGASVIGFTDTVGILDPDETKKFVFEINKIGLEEVLLAVHFHNDLGMAVANSLSAIETGYVNIFQGTIGGIGERSGNAQLEAVVMALELNKKYKKKTRIKTEMLTGAYELVKEFSKIGFSPFTPIVGENIFRTEAGIHQDGILKNPETYEIFPSERVGRKREFVIGKHSGRHAVFTKFKELGYNIPVSEQEKFYNAVKVHCDSHGCIYDFEKFFKEYKIK